MANKKPQKIQDFNGCSIYQDPKHGSVYYDVFTKRAFNLTSSDVQACLIYTALFPTALAISLALATFAKIDIKIAMGIGIVGYALAHILFRVIYFYKLPEIKNWKPIKQENFLISFAKKYSIQRLIVLAILFVVIAVCTIIYGKMEGSALQSLAAGYVMAGLCICGSIFSLIALAVKKKKNL